MSWQALSRKFMQDVPVAVSSLSWHRQIGFLIGGVVIVWTIRAVYVCASRKKRRDLRGQVVCVTGAAGGLGAALAEALWTRGAKTILTGRNLAILDQLAGKASLVPDSFEPVIVEMDLLDLDSIPARSEEILRAYGHVDVLIHNAGVSSRGKALNSVFAVDFDVMKTNYLAPVALTKNILPKMMEHGGGCIVAVSSVQGKLAIPYRSAYSPSKHALQAFFDCLRPEVADDKIEILVVSPGYIRTGLSLHAMRGDGALYGKTDEATANGMEPKDVAERIIRAIEGGEREVLICGFAPKVAIVLRAVCASLYFYLMEKRGRKQREFEDS